MKVLTAGSAMIDTIAVIASDRIEQMTMRNADTSFLLLEQGRKTDALEVSTHCGGGAINTAVAMARLGHEVAVLVKVGRDTRAGTILARLAEEGICTRWVARDDATPTGASVMISSHDRNAAIFTYRGANATIEPRDIDAAALGVDAVYIASLSNRSADCFPTLVRLAREQGAFIATNPGIRQLSARPGPLLECLADVDLLVMNRLEGEALVPALVARAGEGGAGLPVRPGESLPDQARRPLSGGGFNMAIPRFLSALREHGVRHAALTLGRHGALLGTGRDVLYCPALEIANPAGSAGAGDAFAATLTAWLASGRPPASALQAAAVNAASVVCHTDTQSGLLGAGSLDERLAAVGARLPVCRWADLLHIAGGESERLPGHHVDAG